MKYCTVVGDHLEDASKVTTISEEIFVDPSQMADSDIFYIRYNMQYVVTYFHFDSGAVVMGQIILYAQ